MGFAEVVVVGVLLIAVICNIYVAMIKPPSPGPSKLVIYDSEGRAYSEKDIAAILKELQRRVEGRSEHTFRDAIAYIYGEASLENVDWAELVRERGIPPRPRLDHLKGMGLVAEPMRKRETDHDPTPN